MRKNGEGAEEGWESHEIVMHVCPKVKERGKEDLMDGLFISLRKVWKRQWRVLESKCH